MGASRRVPVVDGLFTETGEGPRLQGSKCPACGAHYFPRTGACNNPDCTGGATEEVALSPGGKLWSYTIQYYPPPPPFRFEQPFTPYAIGLVELPEGLRVLGMVSTDNPEGLRVGLDVELVLEKLYCNEDGDEMMTWKFRLVERSGAEA